MNVAIPKLNDSVAACFEVAKHFDIFIIKNNKIVSKRSIECHGNEGFQRVRLLRLYEIHTLICSGIKRFYLDQLLTFGIMVIPGINDTIENAINRYKSGKLASNSYSSNQTPSNQLVSHDELIKWTKSLFIGCGYSILHCENKESSLVDLVAEINCPVCNKNINVAVCCGAQIYRVDQEIMEFHHSTKTRYKARVYVYFTDPKIAQSCDEYNITFISPEMNCFNLRKSDISKIPIIQKPIEGHERAFTLND
jgi:predicted Fe-Mo cluster-binding NifX family protein